MAFKARNIPAPIFSAMLDEVGEWSRSYDGSLDFEVCEWAEFLWDDFCGDGASVPTSRLPELLALLETRDEIFWSWSRPSDNGPDWANRADYYLARAVRKYCEEA